MEDVIWPFGVDFMPLGVILNLAYVNNLSIWLFCFF